MVIRTFCTGVFLIACFYLLLTHQLDISSAAPVKDHHLPRPALERYPRYPHYARIKTEPLIGEFVDEDDFLELSKRQQSSDDYGHLRFGRRNGEELSDDYGHMRFGRSGSDKK
ncbi:unnamed protein product [Phyllotreta striolata]|uniref:Sulfakinin n=1 Tax=Phyllotreta striolata TaxID=444603 RepID=A0A9N9TXQ5_PHYSR|nr:unnamed protein product [Phyllotreta striolata]